MVFFMKKNIVIKIAVVVVIASAVTGCNFQKISDNKTKDIDFTVVAENEIPKEVSQMIEERKEKEFKVTYSDKQYTYIIVGYGKQNFSGYSIQVKNVYETENAICVKTEFQGPKEYTNQQLVTYPYIVIKILYNDKSVIFSE